MKRYLEVSVPGSSPVRFVLGTEPVTLGSAAPAKFVVRQAKRLEAHHLDLVATAEGCRIGVASGVESLISYNGQPARAQVVPWGHDAFVDGIRLSVLEREPEKHSSLVLVLLLVLALPVGFVALRDLGMEVKGVTAPPEAPSLLDEKPTPCTQPDPAMAAHRADRALLGAEAKVARYPFQATDGLDAVSLYAEARACYEQGGKPEDAARVDAEQKRWRERLEQEYHGHRLRLRLALENKATAQALHEIARLRALLARVELHPYVAWLGNVERRLKKKTG